VTAPRNRPFVIVLAAPSGAGKTSLARALLEANPELVFSVSATTRPRRGYERDGEHYHFVDDTGFDELVRSGELLEWAAVHDRRYGTPRRAVEAALKAGHHVVLDVDVQGARAVRLAFPDAVLVFILPPSGDELVRRLSRRASEAAAERVRRMRTAREELVAVGEFDYVVLNDDFQGALRAIEGIIAAERHRVARDDDIATRVAELGRRLEQLIERESEDEGSHAG
jgi:guanylate kinase